MTILLLYSFIESLDLIDLKKINEKLGSTEKIILFVHHHNNYKKKEEYDNIIIKQHFDMGDQDSKIYLKCNSHVALKDYKYDECMWVDECIWIDDKVTEILLKYISRLLRDDETDAIVVGEQLLCRKKNNKTTYFNREWYFNQKLSLKEIALNLKIDYNRIRSMKYKRALDFILTLK